MKTKPLVLAVLTITAVMVSVGSARAINFLSHAGGRALAVHGGGLHEMLTPKLAAGVAKAVARVLQCRL